MLSLDRRGRTDAGRRIADAVIRSLAWLAPDSLTMDRARLAACEELARIERDAAPQPQAKGE